MKTKLIFALFTTLFFAATAQAGTASGKVVRTLVFACPTATAQSTCALAVVKLSAPIASPAACQDASVPSDLIFALDNAAGKAMYNAVLHAQAVGAVVVIVGDGTCIAAFGRERASYIVFDYPQ